jgi:hypothetical protein
LNIVHYGLLIKFQTIDSNKIYTVTRQLKARILKPEETSVAKQWFCNTFLRKPNHVIVVTYIHI